MSAPEAENTDYWRGYKDGEGEARNSGALRKWAIELMSTFHVHADAIIENAAALVAYIEGKSK